MQWYYQLEDLMAFSQGKIGNHSSNCKWREYTVWSYFGAIFPKVYWFVIIFLLLNIYFIQMKLSYK